MQGRRPDRRAGAYVIEERGHAMSSRGAYCAPAMGFV